MNVQFMLEIWSGIQFDLSERCGFFGVLPDFIRTSHSLFSMNTSKDDGNDGQSKGIITFKINNFSESIEPVLSTPHSISGLKWRIHFEFSEGHPSVYLQCVAESSKNEAWCCYAKAELSLLSQKEGKESLTKKFRKCFHSKMNNWGFKPFGTFNQFTDPEEGYIENATIILRAHIKADFGESAVFTLPASMDSVNSDSQPLSLAVTNRAGKDKAYKVCSQLNELRKANILCDVNICVKDAIFPCHRNVLASACAYFKAMFTNNFVELEGKDTPTLHGIESNVFEQILDFMYTGKICINHENVYSLLIECDFLGLQFVEELCVAYLENHMPKNNIAKLCSFAMRKDNIHMMDFIIQPHVAENFVDLSKDLLSLPSDVLVKVLSPDCFKSNTNAVLGFLLEWVKVNRETQLVFDLLKSVDILTVDVSCLSQIMTSIVEVNVEEYRNAKSAARKKKKRNILTLPIAL